MALEGDESEQQCALMAVESAVSTPGKSQRRRALASASAKLPELMSFINGSTSRARLRDAPFVLFMGMLRGVYIYVGRAAATALGDWREACSSLFLALLFHAVLRKPFWAVLRLPNKFPCPCLHASRFRSHSRVCFCENHLHLMNSLLLSSGYFHPSSVSVTSPNDMLALQKWNPDHNFLRLYLNVPYVLLTNDFAALQLLHSKVKSSVAALVRCDPARVRIYRHPSPQMTTLVNSQ